MDKSDIFFIVMLAILITQCTPVGSIIERKINGPQCIEVPDYLALRLRDSQEKQTKAWTSPDQ